MCFSKYFIQLGHICIHISFQSGSIDALRAYSFWMCCSAFSTYYHFISSNSLHPRDSWSSQIGCAPDLQISRSCSGFYRLCEHDNERMKAGHGIPRTNVQGLYIAFFQDYPLLELYFSPHRRTTLYHTLT